MLESIIDGIKVTIVGTFPPVSEGQNIKVEGFFKSSSSWGKQFQAERIYLSQPMKIDGIKKFLASGLIKGLGPVTAENIVAKYGVLSLEKMNLPIDLAKVPGISLMKATNFGIEFNKLKKMQSAVMFLQDLGISINLAMKIYKVYDNNTENMIKKNPYILVDDIDGVGFLTADRIAGELGIEKTSDYRINAGISFLLGQASTKSGHNYLPYEELAGDVVKLLCFDPDEMIDRVKLNIDDMVLLGELIKYQTDEHTAVMTVKNFQIEKNIAERLIALKLEQSDFRVDINAEIAHFEKTQGFKLHENQVKAVKEAVENGVHIITGGPGTGKTTIVKCILQVLKNLGQRVALTAPTGRASKRLSESTGEKAKTIHRMLDLDWKNGKGFFAYNENTKLPLDVIIVDEISMVDEFVFNALLRAMARGTRIIMVGDKDQLASVGAGNVLSDIINCNLFSISNLTHIYRQSSDSKIVPNAHKINMGKMPDLDNKCKDFFFEEREQPLDSMKTVLQLVTERLPKYLKVDPVDIQVLCPMKRGVAGIINLNRELQQRINPPSRSKPEIRTSDYVFRVGDKVMQMQNNYQQSWTQTVGNIVEKGLGVFNGDIGFVQTIDNVKREITIIFDDERIAKYSYDDIGGLSLAYAVTIHKSQGSEFKAVVVCLESNFLLQTRNLLYTAVTRAKEMVVLVGSKKHIFRMIRNNETSRRYSLLSNFLVDEAKRQGLN